MAAVGFPTAERRPLRRVLKFVSQGKYECLGLWRGEEQVGYAFLALDGRGGALLDYYAMGPGLPGKGYGSAFFPLIARRYPAGILAEVESPEKASRKEDELLRRRRVEFYQRLGWRIPAFAVCFMEFPMKSCGSRAVGGQRSFSGIWMDFTGS